MHFKMCMEMERKLGVYQGLDAFWLVKQSLAEMLGQACSVERGIMTDSVANMQCAVWHHDLGHFRRKGMATDCGLGLGGRAAEGSWLRHFTRSLTLEKD